ncbi:MAG: hypothetical protein HFH91_05000 [Lachnospiraceae bacterium]|nr:hypothetical protein [Lachnospiraceae bacterium]
MMAVHEVSSWGNTQEFIPKHFYHCTDEILRMPGKMYAGGDFTKSIDQAGGPGTAAFEDRAIQTYCGRSS